MCFQLRGVHRRFLLQPLSLFLFPFVVLLLWFMRTIIWFPGLSAFLRKVSKLSAVVTLLSGFICMSMSDHSVNVHRFSLTVRMGRLPTKIWLSVSFSFVICKRTSDVHQFEGSVYLRCMEHISIESSRDCSIQNDLTVDVRIDCLFVHLYLERDIVCEINVGFAKE